MESAADHGRRPRLRDGPDPGVVPTDDGRAENGGGLMDRPKVEGPWETAIFLVILAVTVLLVVYAGAMMVALLRIVWRLGNP